MHMLCLIYSQRKYPVEILACLDSNSGTKLYIQLSWQLCSWDNEILTQMLGRTSRFWRGCLTGEKKSPVELWVLHLHSLPEDLDAISPSALVCWHCCDRGPPAGWLTQQKLIVWPFQRLNVQFKVLASLVPSGGREGKICPKPLSLLCRQPCSCSQDVLCVTFTSSSLSVSLCASFPFL